MEFKSIEDAIRFAIQKEEASAQFYRDIAERMENAATKIIFEVLGRIEMQHKYNLELELMKIGKIVMQQSCDIPELPDDTYIEVDEDVSKMSFMDALQVAIRKERAAFVLYVGLMSQAINPELRQLFMDLAEEEMRHLIQFENEYNSVASENNR